MAVAIQTSHPWCQKLQDLLRCLSKSGTQTTHLTEMAYEWCSVVYENYSSLEDGEELLLLSLEIGFRHLNPEYPRISAKLTHTEYHIQLAEIVFESEDGEAIADLLHAWTSTSSSHEPYTSLNICAKYLIGLHHLHPFSSRLRQLIIYAIPLIGYQEFKQVGFEGFVELLDDLQVHVEVTDVEGKWPRFLLDIIQSSEGIQNLSPLYWELLVRFAVSQSWVLEDSTYSPHTMISLKEAEEWDKLECWMGVVWMSWPPKGGKTTEEDLGPMTLSLFHQQPGAVQKLEKWMEQWADGWRQIPESFQQICKQAHDEAAQEAGL